MYIFLNLIWLAQLADTTLRGTVPHIGRNPFKRDCTPHRRDCTPHRGDYPTSEVLYPTSEGLPPHRRDCTPHRRKIWHILWNGRLNSDGQQSHQYQQNEQSLPTFTYWTQKRRPRHITSEIQLLSWDRHTNVAGFNRLFGCKPSPLNKRKSKANI